jgi:hypothetical protein
MPPKIVALVPVFSYDATCDRFCIIDEGGAPAKLQSLGQSIAGNPGALVGIYCTKHISPEDAREYRDDPEMAGRIVALVRTKPMPRGLTIRDYYSGCHTYKRGRLVDRWPVGWSSETVFFSTHGGPFLDIACMMTGNDYVALTHQFLQGPIDLRRFAFKPLRDHLMNEIRHQITRDPATMIGAF